MWRVFFNAIEEALDDFSLTLTFFAQRPDFEIIAIPWHTERARDHQHTMKVVLQEIAAHRLTTLLKRHLRHIRIGQVSGQII